MYKVNYYDISDTTITGIHYPEPSPVPVKENAAVTPAQIAELTANGMAVSSSSLLQFDDGSPNPLHFPLEQSRGVDVNDVWNASLNSKRRLNSIMKSQPSTDVHE